MQLPLFRLNPEDFNPRTYVRCDLNACTKLRPSKVFQSTHLREVRPSVISSVVLITLFQSTHLREVRQLINSDG